MEKFFIPIFYENIESEIIFAQGYGKISKNFVIKKSLVKTFKNL